MTTDLSTGTVYEASSGFVDSSMSTGNPHLPIFGNGITDRWVVSSPDGVHWTNPAQLGGCDTTTIAAHMLLGLGWQQHLSRPRCPGRRLPGHRQPRLHVLRRDLGALYGVRNLYQFRARRGLDTRWQAWLRPPGRSW